MAQIYYERIRAGLMTIAQVPERWRNDVQRLIDREGQITDTEALNIILGKEEA